MAGSLACPRQRVAQIAEKEIKTWSKGDHTPKKNGNQCDKQLEELIVHVVEQDFNATYNVTAKHVAMITGKKVSANLVIGVRKRNNLEKPKPDKTNQGSIRTNYDHVVSIDVMRESGEKIFGYLQDKTKVVYHHLTNEQTAKESLEGLKAYILLYGKPDAVRTDNGSEFKAEFAEYLRNNDIKLLHPLPYNPGANGFIERYFRILRADTLRRLKKNLIKVTQRILDDVSFLWNYCRQVQSKGKTPAELAGLELPMEELERFQVELETVGQWKFWHIKGVHGLMHAFLPEHMLNIELN